MLGGVWVSAGQEGFGGGRDREQVGKLVGK